MSSEQQVRELFACGVKKAEVFKAQCEALAIAYSCLKHAEATIEPIDDLRRYLSRIGGAAI